VSSGKIKSYKICGDKTIAKNTGVSRSEINPGSKAA
jgi:hypothetical protein